MTIPTLIKNIQDAEFKSAWKKEFSVLANATTRVMTDNGGTMEKMFVLLWIKFVSGMLIPTTI